MGSIMHAFVHPLRHSGGTKLWDRHRGTSGNQQTWSVASQELRAWRAKQTTNKFTHEGRFKCECSKGEAEA